MASDKKRRKESKLAREYTRPRLGPARHPDGDRRRRGGPTADQGIADKRAMREFGALVPDAEVEPGYDSD